MYDTELWRTFHEQASQRKRRLYECACCRLVRDELKDDRSRAAAAAAELYADGGITREQLAAAEQQAWHVWNEEFGGAMGNGTWDERSFPYAAAAYNVAYDEMGVWGGVPIARPPSDIIYDLASAKPALKAKQSELIQDLLGPSAPAHANPSWHTFTVVALARQMYDAREFSAMPILADALQDAGCDHEPILSHCRRPGSHIRGCWVVDLVLGTDGRPEHEDAVFGHLKWDGRLNGWLGEVDLRPGVRVGVVVLGADEDRAGGFHAARDVLTWLRANEATARDQVATDMVRLHNDRRPVGTVPLTAGEFASRLELFRAELPEDGYVRLSFRDDPASVLGEFELVSHFGPDRAYLSTSLRRG